MTNPDSSGGVAVETPSSDGEAPSCHGTLLIELLDWLAREPRTHRETIHTWGSQCPRITPWEDAQAAGLVLVTRNRDTNGPLVVVLSRRGESALEAWDARGDGRARVRTRPLA